MGERHLALWERFSLGLILLGTHLSRFISLEFVGGPLILLLALLGMVFLKKKNEQIYLLFLYWVLISLFLLSFVVVVGRSHLKDFNWLIPFLVALGIYFLSDLFKEKFSFSSRQSRILLLVIGLAVSYHLILADHVVFGKIYDDPSVLKLEAYVQKIKNSDIADKSVIAIGLNSKDQVVLNYLADKSTIVLTPETMQKLIQNGQLASVLQEFKVDYILGYSKELSSQIEAAAKVKNISSDDLVLEQPSFSFSKSFFMGIVR